MTSLVFLPGWGFSGASLERLRAALPVEWESSVFETQARSGETLQDWAGRIAPALPAGAIAVGWSLGAMLALAAASQGAALAAIVAIGATARFTQGEDWPQGLPANTVDAFVEGWANAAERTQQRFLALQAVGDQQRSLLTEALRPALLPTGSAGLADSLAALAGADLRGHMGALTVPVLLLHGAGDALMPVAAAQWLAGHLGDAELQIFAGAGHALPLSEAARTAAAIRGFVERRLA